MVDFRNYTPGLPNPIVAGGIKDITLGAGAAPVICHGSGAPTLSAPQGSIYFRTDGGASTELYVARDNAGTWKAVTTAA